MIECPGVARGTIRGHYDLSTVFYRLLWGNHIHHGLWEADESPRVAQVQLTETMANLASIDGGERLLDVGCGMGGSSIHLAKTRGCSATGITVSRLQRRWASISAGLRGAGGQTRFLLQDAEQAEFPSESFDIVWSIECTEHLFDKPRFIQQAAQWLKPGGRMAICAWLAGENADTPDQQRQLLDVCEGFFCPSLGSARDYIDWMQAAGLQIEQWHDWTDRVYRTWEICDLRVKRSGVRWLARAIDRNSVMFLDRFQTILDAFRSQTMQYGCFIAEKPAVKGNR